MSSRLRVYDHPRYYDIGFGWDPTRELDFLEACFKRYGRSGTRSVLELGCGTGRLLLGLAERGYRTIGVDNNHRMIEYLSDKARRVGVQVELVETGMASFAISEHVDAAFCAINTFRYLMTEKEALRNLSLVGESLAPAGIYVVDLNLLGSLASYPKSNVERWEAHEGRVSVEVTHKVLGVPDVKKRTVLEEITLMVRDGDAIEKIGVEEPMRTYTRVEFEKLVRTSGCFKVAAWHSPEFDIDKSLEPGPETERVIAILKKM